MLPFEKRLEMARNALAQADFVLLGGGAGLSAAAGLDYGGARFERYFSDYKEKYGITDMYAGMFYPFRSSEERWAHHARHILVNRFEEPASPLYRRLFSLLKSGSTSSSPPMSRANSKRRDSIPQKSSRCRAITDFYSARRDATTDSTPTKDLSGKWRAGR